MLILEYELLYDEYESYIRERVRQRATAEVINEMKGIFRDLKGLKSA